MGQVLTIKGFSLKVGTLSWQVASAELLEQGGDGALSTAPPSSSSSFSLLQPDFYRLVFLFTHMNHMKNKKIINNTIQQKFAEQVHSILLT